MQRLSKGRRRQHGAYSSTPLQPESQDVWPLQQGLIVARLGGDAVLLDGTPALPGRTLVGPDAERGAGMLGFGTERHVLAWCVGWGGLLATTFEPAVLTGGAGLPAGGGPLVPGDPTGAPGPSRGLLWAGAVGNALMVAWLDTEQSALSPSDRVMYALIYPRLIGR